MNEQHSFDQSLYKLGGYFLIPHELLHVLAYRIIGKPYYYQWGDYRVRSLAKKTQAEAIFVLLLPFVTCWIIGFFFGVLWLLSAFFITIPPERYFIDGPTWHLIFPIIGILLIFYSGTAHRDLIAAYYILSGKNQSNYNSPKPHPQTEDEQPHRNRP